MEIEKERERERKREREKKKKRERERVNPRAYVRDALQDNSRRVPHDVRPPYAPHHLPLFMGPRHEDLPVAGLAVGGGRWAGWGKVNGCPRVLGGERKVW